MYSVCHRSLDKYALWADAVLGCSHAQSNAKANNEPDAEAYRGPDTPANTCAHSGPHPGADREPHCLPHEGADQGTDTCSNACACGLRGIRIQCLERVLVEVWRRRAVPHPSRRGARDARRCFVSRT